MPAARFLIGGAVQGVCFRAGTRAQAFRLGVNGSARNLDDGRVEVLAQGDAAALEALAQWLAHGPRAARVDTLERTEWINADVVSGFITC